MKNLIVSLIGAACVTTLSAQTFQISLGIRETGGTGPAFSNAGSTGGIEWVNRDGQSLLANGTWQLFTFTPAADTLMAFAGTTANSVLDTDWGSLEHLRILNIDGITAPVRIWIDHIANTDINGSVIEGFEGSALGTEVIFQEPAFSGSTAANLLSDPNSSLVSDTAAFAGDQSLEVNFQFVDSNNTRWIRLTTFNTANLPNPAMRLRLPGAPNPTISFYAMATIVPEPSGIAFVGLGVVAFVARLRRR